MRREHTRVERAPAPKPHVQAQRSEPQPMSGGAASPLRSVPAESGATGHSLNAISILPPDQAAAAVATPNGGAQVPHSIRQRAETGLGVDLADTRVHQGPDAERLTSSFRSRALALGTNIFLSDRTALDDERVMMHELVHVAQQDGGRVSPDVMRPGERHEQAELEADHASAALVSGTRTSTISTHRFPVRPYTAPVDAPPTPTGPADVNVGFNPMDIGHKLLIAIDQSQVKIPDMKRHIDFGGVVGALSNLTAAEVSAVKDFYQKHEKGRSLETDIFGNGESGFESDLTPDQRIRLSALLGGTAAIAGASKEEAQDAAGRQRNADAAELHALLHGDLDKADVDRVMILLRRSAEANAALSASYERLYHAGLNGEVFRMSPGDGVRATQLLMGNAVEADKIVIGGKRLRIEDIDKEVAELKENGGPYTYVQIEALQKERRRLAGELGQQLQQTVNEARSEADARAKVENPTAARTAAVEDAAHTRASAVLGDVDAVATLVGDTDSAVIRAIVSDDPVAKAAADLRKAAAADSISASQINATLRGLRDQAESRARLENPAATPDELSAKARVLADGYFTRLATSYDALPGKAKDFHQLLEDTGSDSDAGANKTLMSAHGHLSDIEELVVALSGDRKDTEAVERVLKNKTAVEIRMLKAEYMIRTAGRSLDYDLFGAAPTHDGEENPEFGGAHILDQGKASGTSRLNLEDYMQRPDEEGGLAEVNYIVSRAEREYQYTIDNGGLTGAWRDAWGNEQRDLLDETIKEVRGLHFQYLTSAMAKPEFAHTQAAHDLLQKLRLARATIRGDRAAYEKATAELRATFEAIASFAMQAALMAVLGPLAEAAFIGELAEGASAAMKVAKLAQGAAVSTASTIGANLAVYGNDYSLAMLKADLLGGMGGAIGPAGVDKLVGPYAKSLASKLGPKLSEEIIGLGKTVAGMETAAWAQGQSGDLSISGVAKAHGMGKAGAFITAKVQGAVGLGPHPAGEPTAASGEPAPLTVAELPASPGTPTATESPPTSAAAATPVPTEPTAASGSNHPATVSESAPVAPTNEGAPRPPARQPLRAPGSERPPGTAASANASLVEHPQMPNVLIDTSIPKFEMKALLAELELTPAGSRIADRIRAGDVEVIITNEPIADAAGMALGKEIQITWAGSVEETASTVVHEGTHNLDPELEHGGVPDTMLSHEGIARVEEYEYRIKRKLPPFDAAESAYRDAMLAAIAAKLPPAEVRLAAERAMIAAMQADPARYGVETAAQLRTRMERPVDLPELPPVTLSPAESALEHELFDDLAEVPVPTSTPLPAAGESPARPEGSVPGKVLKAPRRPNTPGEEPEASTSNSDDAEAIENERRLLVEEIFGAQSSSESQSEALAQQIPPETRLSESSASRCQKILEHYINESTATPAEKAAAIAAVRRSIQGALRATNGDRLFDQVKIGQADVNEIIRDGSVTIDYDEQLQSHHDPEVHENPGTYPKTFRSRTRNPWVEQMDQWAQSLFMVSAGQRRALRRELATIVRDSLTEERADSPTSDGKVRSKAVLPEVDLTVTTGRQHREVHRRRGDEGEE